MSYSYNEILAKKDPDIPLHQHIEDCLRLFKDVRRYKSSIVKKFCNYCSLSDDSFWKSAFWCVALHDIGKASIPFQEYIRGEGKRESHAFLSSWYAQRIGLKNPLITANMRAAKRPFAIESLVVANHHSPFRQEKFRSYEDDESNPQPIRKVIEALFNDIIKPKFNEYFSEDISFSFEHPKTLNEVYISYALADDIQRRGISSQVRTQFRIAFALLKSVLHYCDWYASGNISSFEYYPYIKEDTLRKSVMERAKIKEEDFAWKKFQISSKNHKGGVLLQAPTGTGKTEAALLWAMNNLQGRKLLYLMPTMATTNKMYERIQRILGEDIGVVHGTSDYLLSYERDYQDTWEFRRHCLFSKTFIHKCTVLTVDQLLFILFNWGRWDLKLSNASNSLLIFDEIHCYEPYTTALIVEAAKFLRCLGAEVFFMSATFPEMLKDILKKELNLEELPRDSSFDEISRVEVKCPPKKEISQIVDQIISDYREGQKVLVVCNTIKTSKEVFERLKNEIPSMDRMLFHSQFILVHKMEKENKLENLPIGGFVAVTTQVVEVSLDINFDILYTEACPLDALVQRLGRVNRKGNKSEAKAYICIPSERSFYIYDRDVVEKSLCLVKQKGSRIKEKDYILMVNELYKSTDFEKKFNEKTNEVKDLINWIQQNLSYVYTLSAEEKTLQKITTRESRYLTIDAIPKGYEKEIQKLDTKLKRVRYSVRIPLLKKYKEVFDFREEGYTIAKVDYDKEIGVTFKVPEVEDRII